MSLLSNFFRAHGPAPEVPGPEPSLPVVRGESRAESTIAQPYNAPTYLDLPPHPGRPRGYGVHPSVVDMKAQTGQDLWNGYRWWMLWTPYDNGSELHENPCIAASNDRVTWVVPEGTTNPIYPRIGGYNSDTDMVWDPDRRRLWAYWRSVSGTDETIYCGWSEDGAIWSTEEQILHVPGLLTDLLSPSVVRVRSDLWYMFVIHDGGGPSKRYEATHPAGPWGDPQVLSFTGVGQGPPWHVDVNYEFGEFRMILNNIPWIQPAVSVDGITFVRGAVVLNPDVHEWEDRQYRATMTLADDNANYDVWYSNTGSGWRTAYTQIPRKHWWDISDAIR